MHSFRKSLAALAGLSLTVGLVSLFLPAGTRGQGGGNKQPLNVSVVNTPTVRDADSPARQPFHAELPFEVPAGKRLVIEYFSAQATTAPDCHLLSLNVATGLAGQATVNHSFAPTFAVVAGGVQVRNRVTFSHPTRLYADPGLAIGVGHTTSGLECDLQITRSSISGHLVDAP